MGAALATRGAAELEGPGGPQRVTRARFRFGDLNPAPRGPAPTLSADTDRWLAEPGYDAEDIARLRGAGVL